MGVKRPLPWESQETTLRVNEELQDLQPDWHVRRHCGEHTAYVVFDKRLENLICSQKLSLIAQHISAIAGGDKADSVSETALYNALSNDGGNKSLNGGHVKYRWRVRPFTLKEAVDEFNSHKPLYQRATVLGSKQAVQTKLLCA